MERVNKEEAIELARVQIEKLLGREVLLRWGNLLLEKASRVYQVDLLY